MKRFAPSLLWLIFGVSAIAQNPPSGIYKYAFYAPLPNGTFQPISLDAANELLIAIGSGNSTSTQPPSGMYKAAVYGMKPDGTFVPISLDATGALITTGGGSGPGGCPVGTAGQIQMVGTTAGTCAASSMAENGTEVVVSKPIAALQYIATAALANNQINASVLDYFNGMGRIFSYGANSTTQGDFQVLGASSSGTVKNYFTCTHAASACAFAAALSSASYTTTGNITANGNFIATGPNSAPVNVTTQNSVQIFTGNASTQPSVAYINSGAALNNRIVYTANSGSGYTIGFANDAFSTGTLALTITGGFASGITAITSNSGTGAWTHTGAFAVAGALSATSGSIAGSPICTVASPCSSTATLNSLGHFHGTVALISATSTVIVVTGFVPTASAACTITGMNASGVTAMSLLTNTVYANGSVTLTFSVATGAGGNLAWMCDN